MATAAAPRAHDTNPASSTTTSTGDASGSRSSASAASATSPTTSHRATPSPDSTMVSTMAMLAIPAIMRPSARPAAAVTDTAIGCPSAANRRTSS